MRQPHPERPLDPDQLLSEVQETVEHAKRVMAEGHEMRERFEDADQQLRATLAETHLLHEQEPRTSYRWVVGLDGKLPADKSPSPGQQQETGGGQPPA
jgi:hypothetical protein